MPEELEGISKYEGYDESRHQLLGRGSGGLTHYR
jgi:hypothetical protein